MLLDNCAPPGELSCLTTSPVLAHDGARYGRDVAVPEGPGRPSGGSPETYAGRGEARGPAPAGGLQDEADRADAREAVHGYRQGAQPSGRGNRKRRLIRNGGHLWPIRSAPRQAR